MSPTSVICRPTVSEGVYHNQLEGPSPRKMSPSLIIAVTFTSVIVLIAFSSTTVYIYLRRRKRQDWFGIRLFGMGGVGKRIQENGRNIQGDDKKGADVPFFNFKSIQAATNNFSYANKIGHGRFGPVYKGKFAGGQEILVRRLSRNSKQDLEDFTNEVVLIAKLQHWNLVRLLGYCVKEDEKMLLYEYMPNGSLDLCIFDRKLHTVLDWQLRFNIILGIAQALLYLHQEFKVKIIHRDLKPSNILLDEEWNPKIADFWLAWIFRSKQTEANTDRIVGTWHGGCGTKIRLWI